MLRFGALCREGGDSCGAGLDATTTRRAFFGDRGIIAQLSGGK